MNLACAKDSRVRGKEEFSEKEKENREKIGQHRKRSIFFLLLQEWAEEYFCYFVGASSIRSPFSLVLSLCWQEGCIRKKIFSMYRVARDELSSLEKFSLRLFFVF